MSTVVITIRGDQIATYTNFSGMGNNQDREVTVNGIQTLGTASQEFTITFNQINGGATQFQNGQRITITDSDGNVISDRNQTVSNVGINPDAEQGFAAGDEHLILTERNIIIDLGGFSGKTVVYGQADKNADNASGDNDGQLDFDDFPCFTPGTMILTPRGPIDVTDLVIGDLVETLDQGPVPIKWIGRSDLDLSKSTLSRKPIMLAPGCLGIDLPSEPLVVSPDHRIFLSANQEEVLAPAKGLTDLPKVRQMNGKRNVTYISIFTAAHQVVFANGVAVETLYPGPQALRRLLPLVRASLIATCPAIKEGDLEATYPRARPFLTVGQTRTLCANRNVKGMAVKNLGDHRLCQRASVSGFV